FLLIEDPWRVLLTTDHPNGAPFGFYPQLIRLLMDRTYRNACLAEIHPAARRATVLGSLGREYTLAGRAIATRAAPARLLGLADRGHLGAGARADIAAYRPQDDRAAMFRHAALVFKDGALVVRDGAVLTERAGHTVCVTPPARSDAGVERYYQERFGISRCAFDVPEDVAVFETVPCR